MSRPCNCIRSLRADNENMANIAKPPCDEALILTRPCGERSDTNGGWVLATSILGSSVAFIDGTVVNVALPAVQAALGATLSQVQWVAQAYALLLAGAVAHRRLVGRS